MRIEDASLCRLSPTVKITRSALVPPKNIIFLTPFRFAATSLAIAMSFVVLTLNYTSFLRYLKDPGGPTMISGV